MTALSELPAVLRASLTVIECQAADLLADSVKSLDGHRSQVIPRTGPVASERGQSQGNLGLLSSFIGSPVLLASSQGDDRPQCIDGCLCPTGIVTEQLSQSGLHVEESGWLRHAEGVQQISQGAAARLELLDADYRLGQLGSQSRSQNAYQVLAGEQPPGYGRRRFFALARR